MKAEDHTSFVLPSGSCSGPVTTIRINDLVQLRDDPESGLRIVLVNGHALLHYRKGDRVDELFAMGTLAYAKLARISEIAGGFGRHRNVVGMARDKLAAGGVEALVGEKRGRKGPIKTGPQVYRRIVELKDGGESNRAIAMRFGISEAAVRSALKREGYRPPAAQEEQQRLEMVEEEGRTQDAENDGDEAEPSDEENGGRRVAEAVAPRDLERMLAPLGLLVEAPAELVPGENLRFAGALLAVAVFSMMEVLESARQVYGKLRNGFYGLRATVLIIFIMSILRIKRPENLKGVPPEALGRLLGLDRAPEVKTLRRKFNEIACYQKSQQFVKALAERLVKRDPDALGFLYIDGHVRAYHGKRKVAKGYVTQRRLCMPVTTDYWVNDAEGDPLFVVTAQANRKMTTEMPEILREIRSLVGDRPVTVIFDRGGWSPKLFKIMKEMDFSFVTYRKGRYRKFPGTAFNRQIVDRGGEPEEFDLADRPIRLKGYGLVRCVARRQPNGHQTHILTDREDLPAITVAVRMFDRWRQENFFKYMREEFAVDGMVSYAFEEDDPDRLVPNPKVKAIDKERRQLRKELDKARSAYGTAAHRNAEAKRQTMRGFKIAHANTGRKIKEVEEKIKRLTLRRKNLGKKVPLHQAIGQQKMVALEVERRRFVDALKIAAYRAESTLCQFLRPHYKRSRDEARALLREAFRLSGDIEIADDELRVYLEPLSSAHRTRALQGLCETLNGMNILYPEHRLVMKFGFRGGAIAQK